MEREGVGGWEAGRGGGGGEGGGKNPQVKTQGHQASHPQMVLITQLDQRDTIPVEGRVPGWLHPIGTLHRCQCVGHDFTRL